MRMYTRYTHLELVHIYSRFMSHPNSNHKLTPRQHETRRAALQRQQVPERSTPTLWAT